MTVSRDIEVEIEYLTTEAGGRSTPVTSGYRPQFYYLGQDWDAHHHYPDAEIVKPGDRVRAFLAFLSPKQHVGKVRPSMPFLIREGNKVVGFGAIIAVHDLDSSAAKQRH